MFSDCCTCQENRKHGHYLKLRVRGEVLEVCEKVRNVGG